MKALKAKGILTETVEVEIKPLNFLIDLFKHEFMDYDIYDEFNIEDNKLYVYIDVSYHGSSVLEPRLISDDPIKIKKFNYLKNLIELYK